MSELHVVLGTGPLGRSVMNALTHRSMQVRMVNRSGKMDAAPDSVEVAAGDLYNRDNVASLTEGAAVVYQCAQPGYTQWTEKFPALMDAILNGVAQSNAKLVIGDNLYMLGDTHGAPLHEGLPNAAETRKGKIRAQIAEAALDAHRSGKVRVTIGRGSDFFGPYVLGSMMGERVFYPALEGKSAQLLGDLDAPHTQTYIGDFGEALAILGERDEALGQVWHVPNDQPQITQREFVELVFAETGKPVKIASMGKTMVRLLGLVVPDLREIGEMMYEFEQPFVVQSEKFTNTFGMKATPITESIAATVAWYSKHPKHK